MTPITVVGTACNGSLGEPGMAIDGVPRIGSQVDISVTNTAAPIGVLSFGFSSATWNGNPLPIHLVPFGAPGCWVHVAWDISFLSAPLAPLVVGLPLDPTLDGFPLSVGSARRSVGLGRGDDRQRSHTSDRPLSGA